MAKIRMKILLTIISSVSLELIRILFQISIVKMALAELKTEVKDDKSAAIITANIKPLAPTGSKLITINGYAKLEHPFSLPQYFLHISGLAQAT